MTEPAQTADFQAFCDANRRPQTIPPGADPMWLIRYSDTEVPDELFAGEGAEQGARRRFDAQRGAWSISLFKEVARG